MAAADEVLEDETNKAPGDVVDGVGRRNVASSREDDGEAKTMTMVRISKEIQMIKIHLR
jgi:hypothetical protein